ncbi:alpha/beta hydrolase [Streptomyces hoynatensis]|uniref:Alpha/beta hydrolase n=1 Tax=Streptomyces hoynatensis TaxID=1141874 RepID=A0A3A9YCV1_9ACTN|nr:alpha/beta hydrolase [Streptomyces hoynatensis]
MDTRGPARGGGPPLLLVHGWGGDAEEWLPLLGALAPRHRLLVPDLPGHGRTPFRPGRAAPRQVAADLAGWLRRLGAWPVVAVGHSMGGHVVTALAVEHPGLVASVVTLGTGFGGGPDARRRLAAEQEELRREGTAWAVRFAARAFSAEAPPGLRERHVRLMRAMDPEVLLAYREGMYLAPGAFGLRAAAAAYLRGRRCPSLAVHTSPAAAAWERGMPRHPASRVLLWEGCGHYLHEERPAETAALLRDWCAARAGDAG